MEDEDNYSDWNMSARRLEALNSLLLDIDIAVSERRYDDACLGCRVIMSNMSPWVVDTETAKKEGLSKTIIQEELKKIENNLQVASASTSSSIRNIITRKMGLKILEIKGKLIIILQKAGLHMNKAKDKGKAIMS